MRSCGLLCSLLLALPNLGLAQPPKPAAECRSLPLGPIRPGWISSAVYVPSLDRLLVVDSSLNRLLLVSGTGQVAKLENEAARRAALPALLAPTGSGFLLKVLDPGLLELDGSLNVVSEGKVRETATATQPGVGHFYQWTVAGNAIVAYGSIRSPHFQEGYSLGFLRLHLADLTGRPEMLLPFPNLRFYSIGYPYLASLGPTTYFLAMDQKAILYRVSEGGKPVAVPLAGLPAELEQVPILKSRMTGPATAPALYEELEAQTMPAGLYGGPDGFLYLLARRPDGPGRTDWSLYQIDPAGNKIRGLGHLRSNAKHLTVVPSARTWYFFERGDVEPSGRQDIHSMIAVPSTRLAAMTAAGIDLCPELGH
jgi:hypothetical protein